MERKGLRVSPTRCSFVRGLAAPRPRETGLGAGREGYNERQQLLAGEHQVVNELGQLLELGGLSLHALSIDQVLITFSG